MGEGKLTPLTTPTPLNRQSPNIAHVIMSTISPHKPHLVKVAPRVTSPHIAKVTTQFFLISFCTQKYSTDLKLRPSAVESIVTRDTSTDAYSRGVVPFGNQKTIFSHLHPQNPIFGHIQWKAKYKIHIRITAWSIEIRCWNLTRCWILPSTLSTNKIFSVRGTAAG